MKRKEKKKICWNSNQLESGFSKESLYSFLFWGLFSVVCILTVTHRCCGHPCCRIPFKRPIPKVEPIGHVSRMWHWTHCKLKCKVYKVNLCAIHAKCIASKIRNTPRIYKHARSLISKGVVLNRDGE